MGTVKHSGRFPWGSKEFKEELEKKKRNNISETVKQLKEEGESNKDIANELGIKEAQVRKIES